MQLPCIKATANMIWKRRNIVFFSKKKKTFNIKKFAANLNFQDQCTWKGTQELIQILKCSKYVLISILSSVLSFWLNLEFWSKVDRNTKLELGHPRKLQKSLVLQLSDVLSVPYKAKLVIFKTSWHPAIINVALFHYKLF